MSCKLALEFFESTSVHWNLKVSAMTSLE